MPIRKPKVSYQEARAKAAAMTGSPIDNSKSEKEPVATEHPAAEKTKQVAATIPAGKKKLTRRPPKLLKATKSISAAISADVPVSGVSKSFDFLKEEYGVDKALQLVISKAYDTLEKDLADGHVELEKRTYEATEDRVNTSRRINAATWALAKNTFDPMDVLPERALARELTKTALMRLFDNENS